MKPRTKILVIAGSDDACTSVLKAWSSDPEAFYCCGSAIGPHPFPKIVQFAQSIIGKEIKKQILEKENRLPDAIVACYIQQKL